MKPSKYLLPLAWLYGLGVRVRNWLYDRGYRQSFQFDLPVICVGNLTAGGTGKTPHVAFLAEMLGKNYRLAILSRGYGRSTHGFRLVAPGSIPSEVGDEPMLYFQRYGQRFPIAVCEDRVTGISSLLGIADETELVLLDDAFQHRALRAGFNILLSDYQRPFYRGLLLPAGYLREPKEGAKRADCVIVTKCPKELGQGERERIKREVQVYAGQVAVFFSHYEYGQSMDFNGQEQRLPQSISVVTGIANASPFLEWLGKRSEVKQHIELKDHVRYSKALMQQIVEKLAKDGSEAVVTTEKDAVKLKLLAASHPKYFQKSWLYVPIQVAMPTLEQQHLWQLMTVKV